MVHAGMDMMACIPLGVSSQCFRQSCLKGLTWHIQRWAVGRVIETLRPSTSSVPAVSRACLGLSALVIPRTAMRDNGIWNLVAWHGFAPSRPAAIHMHPANSETRAADHRQICNGFAWAQRAAIPVQLLRETACHFARNRAICHQGRFESTLWAGMLQEDLSFQYDL